jgi:hypothetical protein
MGFLSKALDMVNDDRERRKEEARKAEITKQFFEVMNSFICEKIYHLNI